MAPATKGTQTVLGGLSGIGLGLLKVTIYGAACICACLLKSLLASVEAGLIQSLSQMALLGLSAWSEVGGIASSLCSKAFLPQPIST